MRRHTRQNPLATAADLGTLTVTPTTGSNADISIGGSVRGSFSFPATTWGAVAGKPVVFYAEEFGVIADGAEHNNVANLLDCMATCAAAGGGTIILPPGVIATSEADIGTVTATSGANYTNNGGVPIPVDTPITIQGHGPGVTTLKCSPGFMRGFDFWMEENNQHYRDVIVRDITVDRDNILGVDIAAPATTTGAATLIGGGWTTLPGISATDFKNAQFVFFPNANSGTSAGRRLAARVSGSNVQVLNTDAGSMTVSSGDTVQGAVAGHVIVGSNCGLYGAAVNMTFVNITVENCEGINIAESTAASVSAIAPNRTTGVDIYLSTSGTPSAVPSVKRFRARNVRLYGGAYGISVCGNPGTFVTDIVYEDCFHDTMIDPIANSWNSAGFMIGQSAWVGSVGMKRCWGRRAGDVAYEIDQPWCAVVEDCTWEEAMSACYRTTFVPPARTEDGPPTAALDNGGALSSGATSCVITALPDGVSRAGIAVIEAELVAYTANSAGTTLALTRGINGSEASGHSDGTAVTFVETSRTRLTDVRSTIRNKDVLTQFDTAGRAFFALPNGHLPLPPMSIRDVTVDFVGGTGADGRVMYWEGWQPDLDIEGLKVTWTGLDQSGTGGGGSLISSDWADGADLSEVAGIPQPRLYGRNNHLLLQGKVASGNVSWMFHPLRGWVKLDFDATYESILTGIGFAASTAVRLGGGGGELVLAPGSRLGVKLRAPYVASDLAPVGITVGSTSDLTITAVLDVDLDLSEADSAFSSTDANYRPWNIDSSNVNRVRFGKLIHPPGLQVKHAAVKRHTVSVAAGHYFVQPWDEIIMADPSAGEVVIHLPNSAGGASGLGEAVSLGRELKIVDAGFAAATHPVTILPVATDRLDNLSAGTTAAITSNGGSKKYVAAPSRPGWIST